MTRARRALLWRRRAALLRARGVPRRPARSKDRPRWRLLCALCAALLAVWGLAPRRAPAPKLAAARAAVLPPRASLGPQASGLRPRAKAVTSKRRSADKNDLPIGKPASSPQPAPLRPLLAAQVAELTRSLSCPLPPGAPERVPARLRIAKDGSLRDVELQGPEPVPAALATCLRSQMKAWRLKPLPEDVSALALLELKRQ
jgi:hypothetical protein